MIGARARSAWLLLVLISAPAAAGVEVRIEGLDEQSENNARAFLQITRLEEQDDVLVDRVRRLHRSAPEQIRSALEPLGYYRAQVDAELTGGPDDWVATYSVDPGEPLRYEEVDIRLLGPGEDDPEFQQEVEELGLSPGDRVHHGRYEQAKQGLQSVAVRRGYFDARWETSRLRVDPVAGEATATLHFQTGPRYVYGDITIDQDVLNDDFVRRYLGFVEGDPFNRNNLLDFQYDLSDSVYFDRVNVVAKREEATAGRVPIHVDTRPRARNQYTWGIGWGTDTGARTRFGWERRRVNRRGHRFEAQAEVAEVRQRYGFAYTIPLQRPARERLVLNTAYRDEEFGDGESEALEIGIRRTRQFSRLEVTEAVQYERSQDVIGDRTDTRRIVVPRLAVEHRRRSEAIYPSRAYRFSAEVRGARESLASDVDFSQIRLEASWIERVLPRTRVLLRGEWGGTDVADVDRLPLSQRFYAGGDNSVRGFDYQSLGPTDDEGNVKGGRYLTTATMELERLLFGDWGAAVFSDVGNVGAKPDMDLEQSVGVGLRWRSPVGVMRLDVAQPITTDGSPRLHLSLGVNL